VRAAKRLLNARSDSREAELLKMETEEQVALIGSPNQIESVMAGLQKRPPRFDEVD